MNLKNIFKKVTLFITITLCPNLITTSSQEIEVGIDPIIPFIKYCIENKKNPRYADKPSQTLTGYIYSFSMKEQVARSPFTMALIFCNEKDSITQVVIPEYYRSSGQNFPQKTGNAHYDKAICFLAEHFRTPRTQFGEARPLKGELTNTGFCDITITYNGDMNNYTLTPKAPIPSC